MSICINDDLIWISVPRCASISIENALLNSSLPINNYMYGNAASYPQHKHITLSKLYNKFGKKETIVIKRNYLDRWISAFQYMLSMYERKNIDISKKWADVDNNFIYDFFSKEYIDLIYSFDFNGLDLLSHQEKIRFNEVTKLDLTEELNIQLTPYAPLLSQMHWVDNQKCTYEFDISEIDKFEKFISDRYNTNFKVKKLNESPSIKNNIIKDDKLKKWVFDNFEKRFTKTNKLL